MQRKVLKYKMFKFFVSLEFYGAHLTTETN